MIDRRRLTAGLATAAGAAFAPRVSARSAETPAYDARLQAAFDAAGPAALAGAVVGAEGMIWSGALGVRHAGGAAVTTGDRWHLGSNTKAMTAALYARLVEAGRARWGATLPQLFPDLEVDAAWREITIEDLLAHRAGLLDQAVIPPSWFMSVRDSGASLPEQRTAVAARALGVPPSGEVGVMAYGNANYILAGAAIERITGVAWEAAIRTEVFGPLGLTTAGFGAAKGDQPWGHRDLFGLSQAVDPEQPGADNPAALGPAGTVHMSLADYGRFLRVFLTDGGDLLTSETVARLTTPAPGADYALGWIAYPHRDWARGPVLAHEGSNTLSHVIAIVAPARGRAFVAATNDAGRGMAAAQGLAQALILATTD